jgi:serine/threonine-protein kinase
MNGDRAMPDDQRVDRLLEELLDSGQTPEEACRTCPELLPQVRAGWQRLCTLRAEVGALFPRPPLATGTTPHPLPTRDVPRIRGYDVQEVLGRGGMGVVYKAWDSRLHRPVAVKMLLAGAYAEPRELERFLREAETVAGLSHGNIVQVYEAGDADGRPFFTMEFVEGGSLAQKLKGVPHPPRQAAVLVATVAEAVHAAHLRGVVHRDLKPGNILLTADGTPKVSDFGLARRLESGGDLTLTGIPVGTPSYMAPEQSQGQRDAIGPATDVFALGAILYEMLAGRPPFRAETAEATLQQALNEDPVPPSRLNPRVPRDLETICLRCLHKEPPRRYASAVALAEDLRRYLLGEAILARPEPRLERLARWVRRHSAGAGLLAAVAILLVTTSVGGLLLYQQQFAARARQKQTDHEVRAILARACVQLAEGWQAADMAKLKDAVAEGKRAEDVARSGGASTAVRQEVEVFGRDAVERLARAKKNHALLQAVLDVSPSHEIIVRVDDQASRMLVLAQLSVDEQYAAAFRAWGLEVDGTAEAEVVARLDAEPEVVVQELIAALDAWMMERRRRQRPEAEWRRLFRVAERLDRGERHRRLRTLLVGESPLRAEVVAGLAGVGSPWPALWELTWGKTWRHLPEVQAQIDPRTEPTPTLVLLAQAYAAIGDTVGAEKLLRRATTARPGQVMLLYVLGQLLERQGSSRLSEAIEYYRAARSQRPQLGMALSKALLGARRAEEAEEVLRELEPQKSNNPVFHAYRGLAAYYQEKFGEAEVAFRKVLDLKPDWAGAHSDLGAALNAQQRFGEAEAACRKALDLKPNLVEAHINMGLALVMQQRYVEAEVACRRALALRNDLPKPYVILGIALEGQGKYGDAEAAHRQALALRPEVAEVYYTLGNALVPQGKYGEAEAAYCKALRLKPDFPDAYKNLGNALVRQQKYREAETAYRKVLALRPAHAENYYNLANVLMDAQQSVEAEGAYRKALALKPDFAEAHTNLGNLLLRQGKHDEAEAAYRIALAIKPDLLEAYCSLSDALLQRQKYVEAEAVSRKGIGIKPDFVMLYLNLGNALVGQERFPEAEAVNRKAIELKPDFASAYQNLGLVLMQRSQFHQAVLALKKAVELFPANDPHRETAQRLQHSCLRYAVLDTRLPGILRGTDKPANAAEQLDVAQLCVFKKHYAAAARFSRDAFTAEPERAEAVLESTRYNAACAAALVGCGQGKDADTLDDKERAFWRRQAVDWLRQDLAWWRKALNNGDAQTKARAGQELQHWKNDDDLAGVRTRGALARLADEERVQWEKLWADVDVLLRRVSQPEW